MSEAPVPDLRQLAEVLVDVLIERGLLALAPPSVSRVIDAREVGRLLGRHRRWVYDHAGELGAFRYGDGPRARLGFDLAGVERWKRGHQIEAPAARSAPARRRGHRRATVSAPLIPYDRTPRT
jgi:hypothetical protein